MLSALIHDGSGSDTAPSNDEMSDDEADLEVDILQHIPSMLDYVAAVAEVRKTLPRMKTNLKTALWKVYAVSVSSRKLVRLGVTCVAASATVSLFLPNLSPMNIINASRKGPVSSTYGKIQVEC